MTSSATLSTGRGQLFSGEAGYEPKSPWGPVWALVMTAVICGASLIAAIIAVVAALASGFTQAELSDPAGPLFSLASPAGAAMAAGSQLASLAVLWLAAGRKGMRADVLQLSGTVPGWRTILAGVLVLLAATSAAEYLMHLLSNFDAFADTKWLRNGLNSPLWWATFLIAVVLAPLWEELTFRGFLLSALAKTRLGFWGGALVANTMWMLLHWGYSWQGLTSVFLAGLILTWLLCGPARSGRRSRPMPAQTWRRWVSRISTRQWGDGVPAFDCAKVGTLQKVGNLL